MGLKKNLKCYRNSALAYFLGFVVGFKSMIDYLSGS